MVIGTLAAVLIVGVYLGLVTAAVIFAIGATLRSRGRIVLACWGLVAWLISAPTLLAILYFPFSGTFSLNGSHVGAVGKPRFIEDFGASALIAYAITSPLFIVPLIRAWRAPTKVIPQTA